MKLLSMEDKIIIRKENNNRTYTYQFKIKGVLIQMRKKESKKVQVCMEKLVFTLMMCDGIEKTKLPHLFRKLVRVNLNTKIEIIFPSSQKERESLIGTFPFWAYNVFSFLLECRQQKANIVLSEKSKKTLLKYWKNEPENLSQFTEAFLRTRKVKELLSQKSLHLTPESAILSIESLLDVI